MLWLDVVCLDIVDRGGFRTRGHSCMCFGSIMKWQFAWSVQWISRSVLHVFEMLSVMYCRDDGV